MTDVRNDITTVWKILDAWSDKIDLNNEIERRAWDDVCAAMDRIVEKLGYDSADFWMETDD